MTLPAENQQTVEALAATVKAALEDYFGQHEPLDSDKGGQALVALRDLVAQADRHASALTETYELLLAGESDSALHALDTYLLRNGLPLARLDGAR